jgi:hypothetical protein
MSSGLLNCLHVRECTPTRTFQPLTTHDKLLIVKHTALIDTSNIPGTPKEVNERRSASKLGEPCAWCDAPQGSRNYTCPSMTPADSTIYVTVHRVRYGPRILQCQQHYSNDSPYLLQCLATPKQEAPSDLNVCNARRHLKGLGAGEYTSSSVRSVRERMDQTCCM